MITSFTFHIHGVALQRRLENSKAAAVAALLLAWHVRARKNGCVKYVVASM